MRWVVGDIHGMLGPLDVLLAAVQERDRSPHFIFVGDYINRGPDSSGVIDRILSLDRTTCLRGNHDDIFDLILHDKCFICHAGAPDAPSAFTWFAQYGLIETLLSYGADAADVAYVVSHPAPKRIRELVAVVPERHRQFLRELLPVAEHEDAFIIHGGWDPDMPDSAPGIAERLRQDAKLRFQALWNRFTTDQIDSPKRWARTGYFGHTPVLNYVEGEKGYLPLRGPKIVLVDTGAAVSLTGRLSAVCIETGEAVQADRPGAIHIIPAPETL